MNDNDIIYFDSFEVKHITKEIKTKFIENKNIITNIYAEQKHMIWKCLDTFVLDILILY